MVPLGWRGERNYVAIIRISVSLSDGQWKDSSNTGIQKTWDFKGQKYCDYLVCILSAFIPPKCDETQVINSQIFLSYRTLEMKLKCVLCVCRLWINLEWTREVMTVKVKLGTSLKQRIKTYQYTIIYWTKTNRKKRNRTFCLKHEAKTGNAMCIINSCIVAKT